ncbi:OmpA family protein [Scandinavium sp.]|uniref:OmpA family protein n=1 Tax=Scandinavium sp. TaxID=2830653 RepID=UPI0028982E7E|nr:OmpA family protein [Scandinavium sp.]
MSERYLFPLAGGLMLTALLLACGIYSSMGWNLLFICLALVAACAFWCLRPVPAAPAPPPDRTEVQDVYLVIGPYVASWFTVHNDESLLRYDRQRLWLAARDARELVKHLNYHSANPEKTRITLFFPFLPDGHDTEALAIGALMSWASALKTITLPEPLPCIFALYSRCSEQCYLGDPDEVIWSGEKHSLPTGGSVDALMGALWLKLARQNTGGDRWLAQRQATLGTLRNWFAQSQLLLAMNSVFNCSSLTLTHFLLADSGRGFIRHGAWSRWLNEHYAVLPGLAKSRIELALPELTRPQTRGRVAVVNPTPTKGWPLWPAFLLGGLLAGSMCYAKWHEVQREMEVQALVFAVNRVDDSALRKKWLAVDKLRASEAALRHCSTRYFFQNWGFAQCDALLSLSQQQLKKYVRWVVFSSASNRSLFASGNYVILPERADRLEPLAKLVEQNSGVNFLIVGHSDNSGDGQQNILLSMLRARAVRDWLITHAHADASRFTLKGVGDLYPLTSNSTVEGREINRRIEVIPVPFTSLNVNE